MASQSSPIPLCLLLILTLVYPLIPIGAMGDDNRKVYIVYMGNRPEDHISTGSLHISMLDVVGSDGSKYLLHSYKKSFHGFSAKLTEEEAQKLAEMDNVVSVFPSRKHQLHTTRSWDFLGHPLAVRRSNVESDVIVGVLDSGIWPESESFSDKGFGPPPRKWKGICQGNFTCNNKIIGARYYRLEENFGPKHIQSPRDSDGHGSHTASTAAGNLVKMASLNGLGLGTARGGVPSARIAVYKVCWSDGCDDHDVLAGFDDAIADGVDIISYSIGPESGARAYFVDPGAIGPFHALRKGILTSISAGNEGPYLATVTSVAPWVLSVAASTTDREFITNVQLGNKKVYVGLSVNAFKLNHMYPLIYGADAPNTSAGFNGSISRTCVKNSLDKNLVKGKIVVCESITTGEGELLAGAVGSVIQTQDLFDYGDPFPLPATVVSLNQQDKDSNISNYIRSTRNPTAIIKQSTTIKDALAPYVASFSSRGPNPISKTILKPDLTAPGVNILAAWSPIAPVADVEEDKRSVPYNIISGTSMACPHATGVAAYIKTFHPKWSPAAIKSALMTTASPMSAKINTDAEFAYGAGHINPIKALDPGLIYDASEIDYINFLCQEGYTKKQLQLIIGNNSTSCSKLKKGATMDLNYPSFVVSTVPNEPIIKMFTRTVTNVGSPVSTYRAIASPPSGSTIQVLVKPKILKFKSVGQKLSFQVGISGVITSKENPILSTSLVWDDGVHQVRSPIVVYALS